MLLSVDVRKNAYYDSVTLMLITKDVKKIEGINEVLVGLGTDLNKELAENLNLANEQVRNLTPNDFFISVLSEKENIMEVVTKKVDELLSSKKDDETAEYKAASIDSALSKLKDADMAVISLPGEYAAAEAKKALYKGLNVMLFSDNVSIEDEVELKEIARDKGLLVMGPDCGTAIINHVPLCFANVVRRGDIGIVGASGTGTQEVTVLIDKLGGGVSQVIGTGGRDLKKQVGGIMMKSGFKALIDDPETKVIVLVSKPPEKEVSEEILKLVKTTDKPVVVDFIGGDKDIILKYGAYPCISLEDAAHKAVALSKNEKPEDTAGFDLDEESINELAENEVKKFSSNQKYLRAFYTGGTLADEAMKTLSRDIPDIYSNIPIDSKYKLKDISKSIGHTCLDLGDDDFTKGKPHPMIDPMGRVERLIKEENDEEIAVVLMDFVIGYGSNVDPAGEMIPSITEAKRKFKERGEYLCVIGYICGTDKDPQNYENQEKILSEAGVILMPSNVQAAMFASVILKKLNE